MGTPQLLGIVTADEMLQSAARHIETRNYWAARGDLYVALAMVKAYAPDCRAKRAYIAQAITAINRTQLCSRSLYE